MKKLFYFVAATLLALTSCTQEDVANKSIPMGKIQASFEESLKSRLAVEEDNSLTWSADDAFTMFNTDGESSPWTLVGEGGTTEGIFGGTELDGTLKGAAFPTSASPSLSGSELTMTLPSELTYQEGICNLPMWASFSSLESGVSFKHLCALLKIDFTNIPKGYTSLIVTSNKFIAGTFTTNTYNTEPTLSYKENGSKSVTITFDAISDGNNNRMFYLPLPVGTYGSINVSISNGENTLSIADWKDRTIERKKVYFASLTYRELTGETITPALVTDALNEMATVTTNATIEITGTTTGGDDNNNTITIPAELSKVNLNFTETPTTSEGTPLTIEEESGTTEGTQLTVTLPASTDTDNNGTYLEINTPTTTVNVEGGNYKQIVATTADNTLVLKEGTIVFNLIVVAGNISIKGGEITGSITRRDPNTGEVIYIYVEKLYEWLSSLLNNAQGFEVVVPDYVTFNAEAEQTFSLTLYDSDKEKENFVPKEVETFEYSVNGGKWTELGTNTVTFGGQNGDLRLRGKSMYGTERNNQKAVVTFGNNDVPVACTGDIRTLIDYEKYNSDDLDTSHAIFRHFFYNCTNLTSAPKLPMTTAIFECYASMFYGCTSLEEAPELPATTLEWGCYFQMFYGCTSLKKAPALPATILAPNCYSNMFYGCIGLTEIPEMSAEIMSTWSCYNMFRDCTGLTKVSKLPAMTLAGNCYRGMFYGCTNLTEAPELPATNLASSCYRLMFGGCTGLTKGPELPAITLADDCYSLMFYECTNLTEAPELPATNLASDCYYKMFGNCTKLTEAPELPATTLADYCYAHLFNGCTNLKKAPELPATTLASSCYQKMFNGCSNLNEVTMLATDISANSCLANWLDGTSSTGTFYKNSSVEDVSSYNIPAGWEVKDYTSSSNAGGGIVYPE